MKKTFIILLVCMISFEGRTQNRSLQSPDWTRDLIIYEIATRGFTSPNGPESGTFNSLKEKIPYLAELGINGVWLTGHHLCESRFFYHCWNEYAVSRPDSIDPCLGSPEEFKALISEFHKNGIKVFLDVITHGVMNNSSLIVQHPRWFSGGSWGMTDYDWFGHHPDLDSWWVDLYTRYAADFGADGYRLDVNIYRPDLWKQIKENCMKAGHPIVVWCESDVYSGGVCDFLQRQNPLSIQTKGPDENCLLLSNPPRHFMDRWNRSKYFQVEAHYSDQSVQYGFTGDDALHVFYSTFQNLPDRESKNLLRVKLSFDPDIMPSNDKYKSDDESNYIRLNIGNLNPAKRIAYFSIRTVGYWDINWQLGSSNEWYTRIGGVENMDLYLRPFVPDVKYNSVQLSSHDDGWDGFPENSNPYVAEGSRCLFGYSFLFMPSIPIFFAGEEFNSDYRPLPNLAPDLYGKGKEGAGKWLYGSWLQWDQLNLKEHAQMLEDVKKMIRIRKENNDLFFAWTDDRMPDIIPLEFQSAVELPTPYMLWNKDKVVIIAGNKSDKEVECTVRIPLEKAGLNPAKTYRVRDIWNDRTKTMKGLAMASYRVKIKPDHIHGGGIAVLKIEKQ